MKVKHSVLLLLVSLLFLGCKDGLTIFDQIDLETELEDAVITGSVTSIVKYNSKLYACDGNIYSKNENDVRGWSKSSKPEGHITSLAASSSALYALNGSGQLFKESDGSWTPHSISPPPSKIKKIFSDGIGNAYASDGGTIVAIDPSSPPDPPGIPPSDIFCRKEKDKPYYYSGTDGAVVDSQGGSVSDLGTVYALTYSSVDSAVYAGTSKGLRKLPVGEDGKLTGANQDPPGNWGGSIKSYEAFAVMATGTNAGDAALYTSTISGGSASAKINGLWGYYYSRRDTWNRE